MSCQRYERLTLIGKGSTSSVYRARRVSDGQLFAYKLVRLAGFTPSTPSSSSQPSTVVSASTVAALTDEEGCLDCVEDERPPSASAEPIEQPPAAADEGGASEQPQKKC